MRGESIGDEAEARIEKGGIIITDIGTMTKTTVKAVDTTDRDLGSDARDNGHDQEALRGGGMTIDIQEHAGKGAVPLPVGRGMLESGAMRGIDESQPISSSVFLGT